MPSTRVTRSRNLNNLHVISTSTASIVNDKSLQVYTLPPKPVMQQPTTIPVLVPSNTEDFFDANNSNYQGGFNVKRRNRKRKRDRKRFVNQTPTVVNTSDYHWFNSSQNSENSKEVADVPPKEETEKVEIVLPTTEEDFEEVEVASSDGDGKKIPVGFRKTKLCYLNYKKKSFFKPKFYNFSSQRTVINCLNVEDDVSVDVDVDVVSEAEYDEYETDVLDPLEKFGKIIEIEDDEMTDEAEEAATDVNDEIEEESTDVVTEESMDSTHAVSNEINKESTPVISNEIKEKSVCDVIKESDGKSSVVNKEANEKSDVILITEKKKTILSENDEVSKLKLWISPACIKDNNDLIQGKSLIQNKLDAWGSHLIGLEYLIEICDKNKTSVLNYYCALCDEELGVQELSEAYVINHIGECSHITRYL